MMWKPSTVEDIRAWMEGTYVPNPSPEEWRIIVRDRYRALRLRTPVTWKRREEE